MFYMLGTQVLSHQEKKGEKKKEGKETIRMKRKW